MKILIANKFYYNRGGDCIAAMALEELLKAKGHDVAFFSMQYPQNFPSEWEQYFPSEVRFDGGLADKLKAACRIFSSNEVKRKFERLADTFKPDVLHMNNVHSYLSPLIGELAHRKGIKVVWTLHDYKLVCPSYSCLRKGEPCTLCIDRGVSNVLTKKCMKGSLPASVVAFLEACYWNKGRLNKNTDCFISPSRFLAQKMIEGEFPKEKIKVVSNFSGREMPREIYEKEDYYCYVGRLSQEKGVETLIEAARKLPYKLVVVGTGPLKDRLTHESDNVRFVGFKEWDELKALLGKAKFMVIPSEWYENNPISVIESLCLGTPVLGADIGGIPELIGEGNGMLFRAGDEEDLREKIRLMFNKTFNYNDICARARKTYSAENYYNKIIDIYEH